MMKKLLLAGLALVAAAITAIAQPAKPKSETVIGSDGKRMMKVEVKDDLVTIVFGPGGDLGDFEEYFEKIRDENKKVRVDGPCMSSCTKVLTIVPAERLCVTQWAQFAFHSVSLFHRNGKRARGKEGKEDEAHVTRELVESYPPAIRSWIASKGGLTPKLITLEGEELRKIIRVCS